MLRIVFLLLALANAGYWLWSHGHLAGLGLEPAVQAEPQRLQEQVKPDAMSIKTPAPETTLPESRPEPGPEQKPEPRPEPRPEPKVEEKPEAKPEPAAPKPVAQAREPESCYLATGIEERQADAIRRALAGKPKADWELVASHQAGRWMVYMGKFPDADFLDRKRGELRLMNIDFDRAGGSFEPGLSLGRFSTEEAAQRQLALFAQKGVRSARVVQERPEVTTYALRLPKATASFKNEVTALAGRNLEPKALRACSK